MPELIRSFASRLRRLVRDRRHADRRQVRLGISLTIQNPKTREPLAGAGTIEGYTRDISPNGLAVIVPAIRLGEHYLAGENRILLITVQIPDGSILIHASPVRYQKLDEEQPEEATHYLIGARIVAISDEDRSRLSEYLKAIASDK
jgi:hypothetical protein